MCALQELLDGHCSTSGEDALTVGRLNQLLDELVAAGKDEDKANVLKKLLAAATSTQMYWITKIILNDLKARGV